MGAEPESKEGGTGGAPWDGFSDFVSLETTGFGQTAEPGQCVCTAPDLRTSTRNVSCGQNQSDFSKHFCFCASFYF